MLDRALLPQIHRLRLPARYAIMRDADGLSVRQARSPEREIDITIEAYRTRGQNCRRVLMITPEGERLIIEFASFPGDYPAEISGVIRGRAPTVENGLLVVELAEFRDGEVSLAAIRDERDRVHTAWAEGIAYQREIVAADGSIVRTGLRSPQAGALHAIAAHWTLSEQTALVVMPTGTGKTEVMIAAAVASYGKRILIIVPTDPLRRQTAVKFESYGLLRAIGVIGDIPDPVVGTLSSRPAPLYFEIFESCNVVITTMSSIGLADEDTQRRFASLFSHVFFDEAHHAEAASWKRFHTYCDHARTALFTATPFREDGKPLNGKMIYNFPLADAQEQGFFRPIHFIEVFEPDAARSDRAIAEAAVARLREDLAEGHDHLLMARAATIDQAERLFAELYAPAYADLNPVVIHSRTRQKAAVLDRIRRGEHRIIVCVNMFGEGVDVPNLKVSALHAVHKSLGITLQFIGRFARTGGNVGEATFVANTAEDGVPEALESLYREDADWNLLLADLSYDAIDPQARLSDLVNNLEPVAAAGPVEISTLALKPKMSAQVYRTNAFYPERYAEAFRARQVVHQPQISRTDNFLVLVVNQTETIDWTDSRDIEIDSWDIYIAYFNPAANLLYVHSSRKGDATGALARKISEQPVLIRDEEVFKVFAPLRRLVLHSVGLSSRSRNVRYQMFAGLDVRNAIDPVQQQSKMKSNVTGVGYEEGRRRSVGCSRKGKIWSMTSGSLAEWRSWCDLVGRSIADPHLHPNDFLKYTLIPQGVTRLPDARALLADWPDQLFEHSNFRVEVVGPERSYDFHECELSLSDWQAGDTFRFTLHAGDDLTEEFALRVEAQGEEDSTYTVTHVAGAHLEIDSRGRSSAVNFFSENPPLVRLEDGSQLAGNILLKPQEELQDTFDRDRIKTLDWAGTDITVESRWRDGAMRANSIQQHFIDHVLQGSATFIIDDDDKGESADIVAIEETDDTVVVYLWHCKYSSGGGPGRRVDDLYEVCGQAQKSVKWTWNLNILINHLMRRETKHLKGRPTRFLRGSLADLATLRKSARRKFITYKVGIVQPGLAKQGMPVDHLTILGATSSFVQTITDNPLEVFASA